MLAPFLLIVCILPFSLFSQSPGGVSGDLQLWLKADAGVSETSGNVTAWNDQSGNANHATKEGEVTYDSDLANFNPSVNFAGNDDHLLFPSTDAKTVFWALKNNSPFKLSHVLFQSVIDTTYTFHGAAGAYNVNYPANLTQANVWREDGTYTTYDNAWDNKWKVLSTVIGSGDDAIPVTSTGNQSCCLDRDLNGEIAELIIYDETLTSIEVEQIESYLGLKYGISQAHDYLSSNGTTIWTYGGGYDYFINGIGRDDGSGLEQLQSLGADDNAILTMGLDSVTTSDSGHGSNFDNDMDFLIWGNDVGNTAAVSEVTTDVPLSVGSRLDREWKISNIGSVGAVDLEFDLHTIDLTGRVLDDFKLLVDTDGNGDFTDGSITYIDPSAYSGGVVYFDDVTFANGVVFTLRTEKPVLTMVLEAVDSTCAGGLATYSLFLINNSASAIEDIVVTDVIPAGFSFFGDSIEYHSNAISDSTYSRAYGQTTSISFGDFDIPAGDSVIINYSLLVDVSTPNGTYTNSITASAPEGEVNPTGVWKTLLVSSNGCNTGFVCEPGFYQVYNKRGQSVKFAKLDPTVGEYTEIAILDATVNGLGLDINSGLAYGSAQSRFIQMNSAGIIKDLDLPLAKNSYSGDMDDTGHWYGKVGKDMVKVNVTIPAIVATYSNQGLAGWDMAFNLDGNFYAVHKRTMYKFDTGTNTKSTLGSITGATIPNTGYGAQWTGSDSMLYISNNGTGEIFRIDIDTREATLVMVSNGGLSKNDGFSCPTEIPAVYDYEYGDISSLPFARSLAYVQELVMDSIPDFDGYWLGPKVAADNVIPSNPDGTADTYDDGLIFPAEVVAGYASNFEMILNTNISSVEVYYGIWIDWNDDDILDDFYSGSQTITGATSVLQSINIPPSYQEDSISVRIRIAGEPLIEANGSGDLGLGETEDYRLTFSLSDNDEDGIADIYDIDDDNDGIPDEYEMACQGTSLIANWLHDDNVPNGATSGHATATDVDATFVSAAGNEQTGPGVTVDRNSITHSIVIGHITGSNLNEAFVNEDYIEYSFTTESSLPQDYYFNGFEFLNRTAGSHSFQISVRVSVDGFTSSALLVEDFNQIDSDGNPSTLAFTNQPVWMLEPSTTYSIRVYFYNLTGPSTLIYDDFKAYVCTLDADTDDDGVNNLVDLDSDNDGIYDAEESGSGVAHTNGVVNGGVTSLGLPLLVDANSDDLIDYTIADSDSDGDYNFQELNSDDDVCPDVREAGFTDGDLDGLLGSGTPTVDGDGVVTSRSDGYTSPNADYATPNTFVLDNSAVFTGNLTDSWSAAWSDYDNDGDPDLFITDADVTSGNTFYVNNGDGTFTNNSSLALTADIGPSLGATWGDYNNDGYEDLFVTNNIGTENWMYENNGNGTFTKLLTTDRNMLAYKGYSFSASWGDYDNDGYLDIFIADYQPTKFNLLYHNNGDGSFTAIGGGDFNKEAMKSVAGVWGDYDNDGDLDLFVANSYQPNRLYRNDGNGVFTATTGTESTEEGNSVGASWGDYDNDGDLDLFVANAGGNNFLYENQGDGSFTKITSAAIVSDGGASHGSGWIDVDKDGWLDMLVLNDQGNAKFLYLNDGDGTFSRTTNTLTTETGNTRGLAFADFDNDWDVDVLMATSENQANLLYENEMGDCHESVCVTLEGTVSNTSGIGAKVKILSNLGGTQKWQTREVSGLTGGGTGGQGDLRSIFGLGTGTTIDSLIVEWPSGIRQSLSTISYLDTCIVVTEPSSNTISGTVFADFNDNCSQDGGEPGIPGIQVQIGDRFVTTDENGDYEMNVEDGTHTVAAQTTESWLNVSGCATSVQVVASGGNDYTDRDFAMENLCADPDLSVSVGTTTLRNGHKNTYSITYENSGGSAASGVVLTFTADSELIPLYAIPAWDSYDGETNTATWNLGTVGLAANRTIYLTDSIDINASIGDTIDVTASIDGTEDDCTPADDSFLLESEVEGPIDPNDIQVSPAGEVSDDQVLTYKIRFQNVGTTPAVFVSVTDTLPEGLDVESLEISKISHPYEFVQEGRVVTWEFPNIYLIDSVTNELASHGYIQFTIGIEKGLEAGHALPNRAAIVFDFNDAIITNTVVNTIAGPYVPGNDTRIQVSPNPLEEKSEVSLIPGLGAAEKLISGFEVRDMEGRKIYSKQINGSESFIMERSRYAQGFYILRVWDHTGRIYSRKLMVK